MESLQLILISCLVSHLISQCSGSSVDISIDEDKITVNIDGRDFPNPCSQTECPDGMKCTVQYAPELLKVPVAHCVSAPKEETHSEDLCVEYALGTNILNCKSTEEWRRAGVSQCPLGNTAHLLHTEVKHLCPAISSGKLKYLTAVFTCCQEQKTSPMTEKTPSYTELPVQDITSTEERRDVYVIPIISSILLVFAIALTLLAIGLRCRRKENSWKELQNMSMSVVNPEIDANMVDCSDKAILIENEQYIH